MEEQSIIYQCALCGWSEENVKEPPVKCKDCGCTSIRESSKDTLDRVAPDAVAHLKKQVKKCWNYDVHPTSGAQSYHDLDIEQYLVTRYCNPKMDLTRAVITLQYRCKHCKTLYSQEIIPASRVDRFKALGIYDKVKDLLPPQVEAVTR